MSSLDRYQSPGLSALRDALADLSNLRKVFGTVLAGRRILWIDDHPENNRVLTKIFEDAGAEVALAESTEKAKIAIQEQVSDFDLVITDMQRGNNTTAGFDILSFIRNAQIGSPVILYSDNEEAHARTKDISELGAVGPLVGPKKLASGKWCTSSRSRALPDKT